MEIAVAENSISTIYGISTIGTRSAAENEDRHGRK